MQRIFKPFVEIFKNCVLSRIYIQYIVFLGLQSACDSVFLYIFIHWRGKNLLKSKKRKYKKADRFL